VAQDDDNPKSVQEKSFLPSLIVLDLELPGVDGFEFMAWRRDTLFAVIPLIVLEGAGNEFDHKTSLELAALHAFAKPVRLNELYCMVRDMMQLLPSLVLAGRECEWS